MKRSMNGPTMPNDALNEARQAIDREMEARHDEIERLRECYTNATTGLQRLAFKEVIPLFDEISEAARQNLPRAEMPQAEADGYSQAAF